LVALSVSLCVALAMCVVPLVAVAGTESALVLGLFQPVLCAYAATVIAQRYQQHKSPTLNGLFSRTLGLAVALWTVPVLVLWLDSFRVRNCSPLQGLISMLLGPLFGCLFASVVATGLALARPKLRLLPLIAAAVPLLTMLRAAAGMYYGPSIFAYGHFFGFFPGTLYDQNVGITQSFLWMRVASCVWLSGLALLYLSCLDELSFKLKVTPQPGRGAPFVTSLMMLALAGLSEVYSEDLGWSSSDAKLKTTLGAELVSERCHLYFPREWSATDRERLAQDCDFRTQQAERWLGLTHPKLINVYLFRSPAEKYTLMGAAGTNLAKPWRSSVYISNLGWPNPVLGHELVHVVAAAAGSGPFGVSGRLDGLWPNPALIEGVATAAAFQPQGGLTLHEWAHAMLELDMVPPLDQLFGPSFFEQQARLAYTLSGSLLHFVHERWGAAAIRDTYRTGSLEVGVGEALDDIDTAWRKALNEQPLAASARDLARARFSGTGVLSALCPHTLAKLRESVSTDMAAGDDTTAAASCKRILEIDPKDSPSRAMLASLRARQGDLAGAEAELAELTAAKAAAPYIASVKQALADQALRDGDYDKALGLYEALSSQPVEEDQRRSLEVKTLATRAAKSGEPDGVRQAQLLFELLVGEPGQRSDPATAVFLARELRPLRQDGLAEYLEGRQLFFQGRYRHAAELFGHASGKSLPTDNLTAEALRVEAICRVAISQFDRAKALFQAFARTGIAHRAEADDYLARIQFMQGHQGTAAASGN
jgi:tetratricopeptide (TPR) repeat protein